MVSGSGCRKLRQRSVVTPLICATFLLALVGTPAGSARASGPANLGADGAALTEMEHRANQADPREKCFLYAQVLVGLTELEGRQIAAGEDEQAKATMQRMDEVAAKVHNASTGNAKRLKNAEQLLERTTRRVADMVRVVSSQQRAAMQSTLQHMDAVHNEVLAMVFSH
jgi:hypothetical protein